VIIGTGCQPDPNTGAANISYAAQITNVCNATLNGTIQFFVDGTDQLTPVPNWTQRAAGTPIAVSLAPGVPTNFSGAILGVVFPASDVYYRVRVIFTPTGGCQIGIYNSDPDLVCTAQLQPSSPPKPVDPPKPKSSAPDQTTTYQMPNAFHLLSRHW
jgi:hypothetical protein